MMRASPGDDENYTLNFSIDCRGLIYQARPRRFTHGFDESNPYNRIFIAKDGYFHGRDQGIFLNLNLNLNLFSY
jgi:hypothetical protein